MFYYDYHVHTNNSFDSRAIMRQVCSEAISRHLKEICFTEHFTLNRQVPTFGHMNWQNYNQEIERNKKKWANQLSIKKGVEICEPHIFANQYKDLIDKQQLDFILGSVHNLDNIKLKTVLEQEGKYMAYTRYFREMLKMVKTADIDVLSHFDLIKRYSEQEFSERDFDEYSLIIKQILKIAIQRNIGIEINTSTYKKLYETMPEEKILILYKSLGGTLLTIGSDAHEKNKVGNYVNVAQDVAEHCGFHAFTIFTKRTPKNVSFVE
ncbi:MAG: histidinol-phosphatase HisJ family protein [Sporolactobacillus sp.]